jgi:hypothetical protein
MDHVDVGLHRAREHSPAVASSRAAALPDRTDDPNRRIISSTKAVPRAHAAAGCAIEREAYRGFFAPHRAAILS